MQVSSIEKHIRQIGLAPTKAKNISNMSKVGHCFVIYSIAVASFSTHPWSPTMMMHALMSCQETTDTHP